MASEEEMDSMLEAIDSRLCLGHFDEVNELISRLDFETLDLDVCVLVLMSCKLAREKLPSRSKALEVFTLRVNQTIPNRAEKLLRWL